MRRSIGKPISKNLSGKYGQKILDHAKQSATDPIKTSSKRVIQKSAEVTGHLIDNKIVNRAIKFQEIHKKIIQRKLKTSMIEEYLKKDMYPQMKDKKFLMN